MLNLGRSLFSLIKSSELYRVLFDGGRPSFSFTCTRPHPPHSHSGTLRAETHTHTHTQLFTSPATFLSAARANTSACDLQLTRLHSTFPRRRREMMRGKTNAAARCTRAWTRSTFVTRLVGRQDCLLMCFILPPLHPHLLLSACLSSSLSARVSQPALLVHQCDYSR